MKQQQPFPGEWRSRWCRAGELLGMNGNRLLLIEGLILLIPTFLPAYLASEAAELIGLRLAGPYASTLVSLLGSLVSVITTLFLTLPLGVGWLGVVRSVTEGEDSSLADMFLPLTCGKRYAMALRQSFGFLWRAALAVHCIRLTYSGMMFLFSGSILGGLFGGFLILAELACSVLWLAYRFPIAYFRMTRVGGTRRMLRPEARCMQRAFFRRGLLFWIKCIPWLALSVLTVGLLAVADLLPRLAIVYFDVCTEAETCTDGGVAPTGQAAHSYLENGQERIKKHE